MTASRSLLQETSTCASHVRVRRRGLVSEGVQMLGAAAGDRTSWASAVSSNGDYQGPMCNENQLFFFF